MGTESERDRLYWRDKSRWGNTGDDPLRLEERLFLDRWLPEPDCLKKWHILSGGCASGRIEFCVEAMGAQNLSGFDFVPEFVDIARNNAQRKGFSTNFFEGDMRELKDVEDSEYDCLLYMNRLLSVVGALDVKKTLRTAARVLKPGGLLLLDALNVHGRAYNGLYATFVRAMWRLQGRRLEPRRMPRMRDMNGRVDWGFWKTDRNLLYWFERAELIGWLEEHGFELLDVTMERDLNPSSAINAFFIACRRV